MAKFFREYFSRSFVKAVTFRIIVIISNIIIITFVTGEVKIVFSVVLITTIVNTLLYIAHERFWDGVAWGRKIH